MLMQCCYHFLLLLIDLLLLRSIGRNTYTSLPLFFVLASAGVFAVLFFAAFFAAVSIHVVDVRISASFLPHGLAWHGSFFLFTSAFLMYRQKKESGKPRRCFPTLILVFGFIYCGAAVDALFIEPTALVIREATIKTPKITKPITIVFCSDMQAEDIGSYERWTLQKIKEQNADLILFGGDYIQAPNAQQLLKDWNELFQEVDLQAPLGAYAVQGNVGPMKGMFDNTAVIPKESTVTEQIGELRITFLSMNDSATPSPIPDANRENQFRIILGHFPRYAMAEQDADLLLAGHTHGGQVQIPFWGPIVTASGNFPKRWASGKTIMSNGATLIVSHGSGHERSIAPRVRFWCRPDFWVIRIVPSEQ
jgi:predicted MPP superfamily phosphohydrolase